MRAVRVVAARAETGVVPDPTGQGRRREGRTGQVALDVEPEWMKAHTVARATMSPAEARELALDLLLAAEVAEGSTRRRF